MEAIRRIIGNIGHALASQAMNLSLGLVASIVLARTLGPNDLGIFHQVQWFAGTVSVIISLGFITSVTKFTAQYRGKGDAATLTAVIRFILYFEVAVAAATTIALLFFATAIATHYFSPDQTFLFKLSFLAITPGIATAVFSAALEGAQVFRYQSLQAFTVTPLSLGLKIALMLGGYGIESLLWSNLLFSFVNLIFYFFAARKEGLLKDWLGRVKADGGWRSELFRFNRSVTGIHFIDLLVWSRSENYFLGRYCQAPQIAYYNLAQNLIARFTSFLPGLVWKILLPLSSEQHGRNENAKMFRTYTAALRYTAAFTMPGIVICFVCAYELVVILFGIEYAPVKTSFRILCVGALFSSLAQPSSAAIYATNRQAFILRYGSFLAVLNIALNIWLIPKHGATGASVCYAVVTTMGVVGGFIYARLSMAFGVPWFSWLKIGLNAVTMGICLWLLISLDLEFFRLFEPWQNWLEQNTGYRFDVFLGKRAVRLVLACCISLGLYVGLCFMMFHPQADDDKILDALQLAIPWLPIRKFIRKP